MYQFKQVEYISAIKFDIMYILVAEIGGTNSNFGFFKIQNDKPELHFSWHYKSQEITDFTQLIKNLLDQVHQKYGITIKYACFAAAGVVTPEQDFCKPTYLLITASRSNNVQVFVNLVRPPPMGEQRYLNLVKHVLEHGIPRADRTGVGTLSVFAPDPLRFDLRGGVLPLLTTKRVYVKGIVEELLWFISGSTDAKKLAAKGVRIWDGNASREFLNKRGLAMLREGDIGAGYGFQWRHFGADYIGCDADYKFQGVDQLGYVVDQIKYNPTSRRIFMSAWNANQIKYQALPPCHVSVQFYVDGEDGLSAHMYQRSADLGLGEPFNIASYALLTHMIAHVCGLQAKTLTISMGDAHIYQNHIDALKTQVARTPGTFPTVHFKQKRNALEAFEAGDVIIENYHPQARLKMAMAV